MYLFRLHHIFNLLTGRYTSPKPNPTPNPIVKMSVNTFCANEPAKKLTAHNSEPVIHTAQQPYFFTKSDVIGPNRHSFLRSKK